MRTMQHDSSAVRSVLPGQRFCCLHLHIGTEWDCAADRAAPKGRANKVSSSSVSGDKASDNSPYHSSRWSIVCAAMIQPHDVLLRAAATNTVASRLFFLSQLHFRTGPSTRLGCGRVRLVSSCSHSHSYSAGPHTQSSCAIAPRRVLPFFPALPPAWSISSRQIA